jgi:endonuclease-3
MHELSRQVAELAEFYGLLPEPPADPFRLFAWEVASLKTTPARRDAAMMALKRARALTPDAVGRAPQAKLEAALRAAGPYMEQRLQALRTGVDVFRRTPKLSATIRGPLRAARRALAPLPQMGDGGAERMLLFAADVLVFPVDARVQRVALRLGHGTAGSRPHQTTRSVRHAIAAQLPRDTGAYRRAYVYLSHHGAATCTDPDPHCAICPLLKECPEGKKRTSGSG